MLTTSPPPSLHLLGAAVKRTSGAAWVADLRDPLTSHPHRRGYESQLAQLKEKTVGGIGRLVASQADAIVAASDAIAEEARALEPKGKVVTIANGSDFDDFAGLEYHPSDRLRITHAGNFHGKRDPKPFFRALAESGLEDVVVRFAGDVPRRPTASTRRRSASATASSCSATSRGAARSSCSATRRRCCS